MGMRGPEMGHRYRVAIVHNIIPPYRVKLFESLSKHPDVELTVYYCSSTHKMRQWEIVEATYDHKVLPGFAVDIGPIANHVNPSIISTIERERFDVVIIGGHTDTTMQLALLACRLTGTPIILWTEGIKEAELSVGRLMRPWSKMLIGRMNAFIVPGNAAKDYVVDLGARPDDVIIAPNMVDNDKFLAAYDSREACCTTVRKELNLEGKKVILFSGRLVAIKGVTELLAAYATVYKKDPDTALVYLGDGELRSQLENRCKELGLPLVRFPGWPSQAEVARYYAAADLFVLPTRMDVWGLAINEAMASGLPVISTTMAGASRDMIVPNDNGFIVPPGDIVALAQCIEKILGDEDLRERMGQRSLELLKRGFSARMSVEGYIRAIERVAKK